MPPVFNSRTARFLTRETEVVNKLACSRSEPWCLDEGRNACPFVSPDQCGPPFVIAKNQPATSVTRFATFLSISSPLASQAGRLIHTLLVMKTLIYKDALSRMALFVYFLSTLPIAYGAEPIRVPMTADRWPLTGWR
jgi:hypothetical protein